MFLARVAGSLVSTIKPASHQGHKLMLVEPIGLDGQVIGPRKIAIDAANAGAGDTVLVNIDGGAALMILCDNEAVADYVICAVVDHYTVAE